MEEKKNQAPQREGGHKNNRRDGGRFNRQGGERREENGQRISVRPGNCNVRFGNRRRQSLYGTLLS